MVDHRTDIEGLHEPSIAVVGVGGAGCNVISEFFGSLCSVDTIAINTDKDSLHNRTQADKKIYICREVLKGEGAHGDATIGKKCADIHREEIREAIAGHDFVFVIAGLGGGTGTGAASVVIEAAQSQGIMTFAIAIAPFFFEGPKIETAKIGYAHIKNVCRNCILVENDLYVILALRIILAESGEHRLLYLVVHIGSGDTLFFLDVLNGLKKFCVHVYTPFSC